MEVFRRTDVGGKFMNKYNVKKLMKKVTNYLLTILLLNCFLLNAQNPYYLEIIEAENKIINNSLNEAVEIYKNSFEKHKYPFNRDVLAAAGIAQYLNDKTQFYEWIEHLLENGLTEQELEFFIIKHPNDLKLLEFKNNYTYYQEKFLENINYEKSNQFIQLDKDDQIRLFLASSKFNKNSPKKYNIDNESLVNRFINLVVNIGYPSDKICGSSVSQSTIFTNEGLPKHIDKSYIVKHITYPDVRDKVDDSVYTYHNFKKGRIMNSLSKRPGYSLLWHQNIKNFPKLDSLLLKGIDSLKIYPSMYAACLERYDIDYLIGMGGKNSLWRTKLKMNINRISDLSTEKRTEINQRRTEVGLRTIEQELELHKAIIKLENLNEKEFTKLKRRNLNLIYYAFFNSAMP